MAELQHQVDVSQGAVQRGLHLEAEVQELESALAAERASASDNRSNMEAQVNLHIWLVLALTGSIDLTDFTFQTVLDMPDPGMRPGSSDACMQSTPSGGPAACIDASPQPSTAAERPAPARVKFSGLHIACSAFSTSCRASCLAVLGRTTRQAILRQRCMLQVEALQAAVSASMARASVADAFTATTPRASQDLFGRSRNTSTTGLTGEDQPGLSAAPAALLSEEEFLEQPRAIALHSQLSVLRRTVTALHKCATPPATAYPLGICSCQGCRVGTMPADNDRARKSRHSSLSHCSCLSDRDIPPSTRKYA